MQDSIVMFNNVKFQDNLSFQNSEALQIIYKNLKSSVNKYHNSKYEICFYLNQLKEFFDKFNNSIRVIFSYSKVLDKQGEYNFVTFCETFFNMSKRSLYRYLQIYNKFFKDNFPVYFQNMLKEFDVSKLAELMILDNDIIRNSLSSGKLKPVMTKKEIVKFVKSATGGTNNVDNSEEDLFVEVEKYCPEKHYEKQYFNSLSKGELVNYIYELQTYCEKIKSKI